MSSNHGATDTLPKELSDALRSAYQEYKGSKERSTDHKAKAQHLAALAASGRKSGWPVRVLAEPCGVSPERLRQIVQDWSPERISRSIPRFPKYERPANKAPEPRTRRSTLSKAEVKRLGELAPVARANTGSRPLDSKYRKASKEFSALIIDLHNRGVIWEEIAEASNMSISGVRLRASRHGHGKTPPSVKPYMDVEIHPRKKDNEGEKKTSKKVRAKAS